MAKFVKPGSHILNAGSHIGLQAITLGRIAGSTGKLFVFQPVPKTYRTVLKNVYLNGLGNMASVYNVGCSNKEAEGVIVIPQANTGNALIFVDQKMKPGPNPENR